MLTRTALKASSSILQVMSASPSHDAPSEPLQLDTSDLLESWLMYFEYTDLLRDLLDDIGRLCEPARADEILKEVCVPIDYPLLAETQPGLAQYLIDDFADCLESIGRLLSAAAASAASASSESNGISLLPGQLLVQPRIFQFPGAVFGVANVAQMRRRLGRLSSLDCQVVCVEQPAQCDRALRFECRDRNCPSARDANSNRPVGQGEDDGDDLDALAGSLLLQRRPGDALATVIPKSELPVLCPTCSSVMAQVASGRVQTDRLRAIVLPVKPAARSGLRWPIRCVALGNRLIRQLTLGRRCRLIGLPVADRVANPGMAGCHFQIIDCEPLAGGPPIGPPVRPLALRPDLSASRFGTALQAAFHLCGDATPPGSWMTVKLAILLQLLAASSIDQQHQQQRQMPTCEIGDEAERLRPISLCIMSPGDSNSVHRLLRSLAKALSSACIVHRCGGGSPVAAAPVAAKQAWFDSTAQATEAGTLALAGPGDLALFPYLAGMRKADLHCLAWAMEVGLAASPTAAAASGRFGPPLLQCGILGLLERAASEADGCYGNDDQFDDQQTGLSLVGFKPELLGMRPELRSLLCRFRLYIECEEPDQAAATRHCLAAACDDIKDLRAKSDEVMRLVLSQRHRVCQFEESAASALQRHFMAGRRVFEAKRLSFGLDSMASLTALAAAHARLNCRSVVITDDVILAAYLLEVSAYCLHGSSHFSISYLGHLDELNAQVAEDFHSCLLAFHQSVEAFMDRLPSSEE